MTSALKKINLDDLKMVCKSNVKVNESINGFLTKLSAIKEKVMDDV
jgi:hypothetical protein